MTRLSGLDAAFLALETPTSTGHIGLACVLEKPPADHPGPTLDLAGLTELIGTRLDLAPVLRRRLREVPLGLDQPYWVDDPDFDLEYHVRELALPAPGSIAQLTEQVSRLHARPLDRSRPLWEIYLIGGLHEDVPGDSPAEPGAEPPDRIVIYTKVHHAAVDGVAGTELIGVLLDLDVSGRPLPDPVPYRPERGPGLLRMAVGAATRAAWRPVETARLTGQLARMVPALAPAVLPLAGRLLGLGGGDGGVIGPERGEPARRAPATPFNAAITPHRRIAFRTVSLDRVKRVKKAHDASVNDVVMALCAGALRRWLAEHDSLPDEPLLSMVPVSVRGKADGDGGNQVSAMLAVLPTHLADPLERLELARRATALAKSRHAAIPPGLIDGITEFAPPALGARAARVVFATGMLHRLPPFNVVVSNIPGPNVPAYLGGARLVAQYPVSVVIDGQGLNITVLGYLGRLHFGLVACRELVPDLDDLAGYLLDELDALESATPG